MILRGALAPLAALCLCAAAAPLLAATPRQILVDAAFQARGKDAALVQLAEADRGAARLLADNAGDRDASLVRAMALGYKAKLTRSRGEALAARAAFEKLAASDPRDPEATAAVGTWHLDCVADLGGFVAGMAIGAKKATGYAMMDRAVTLGGNRALYAGLGGLLRLALDPQDARGRALAEKASKAATPTPLDRIMQRHAAMMVEALKTGDDKAVSKLAKQLLPFGRLEP